MTGGVAAVPRARTCAEHRTEKLVSPLAGPQADRRRDRRADVDPKRAGVTTATEMYNRDAEPACLHRLDPISA
jgi:hypothetical protein